jgi:hypothetical protein
MKIVAATVTTLAVVLIKGFRVILRLSGHEELFRDGGAFFQLLPSQFVIYPNVSNTSHGSDFNRRNTFSPKKSNPDRLLPFYRLTFDPKSKTPPSLAVRMVMNSHSHRQTLNKPDSRFLSISNEYCRSQLGLTPLNAFGSLQTPFISD